MSRWLRRPETSDIYHSASEEWVSTAALWDEASRMDLCVGRLRYAGTDGCGLGLDTVDVGHGFFTIVERVCLF